MARKVKSLGLIGLAWVLLLGLSGPARAEGDNKLYFDNQSGLKADVRVFTAPGKSRVAEVVVPNNDKKGTNLPNGRYYIVIKYGPRKDGKGEDRFDYSKGDPFDLNPPAGKYVTATITLHKVEAGNYQTKKVDPNEFYQD